MSDPVAEAAAQIAEEQAVSNLGVPEAGTTAAGESASVAEQTAPTTATEAVTVVDATTAAPVSEAATELPNAAPAAVESTTEPASALSAAGADTTFTTAASSDEPPLHMRIAAHLEAIYTMAREHVEAAPNDAAAHALNVKAHIGDVLHRISNGMSVAEGELVQKLEALYRAL